MSEFGINELEIELAGRLRPLGLSLFGWFRLQDEDLLGEPQRKLLATMGGRSAGVLIGNHADGGAHQMWDVFSRSPEFTDGENHPMDRWTVRKVSPIAVELCAEPIFPFGDVLWPFQRFAKGATGMRASPLGLLIHSEHGLWQAFRAALLFPNIDNIPQTRANAHPCETCSAKPCLSACPVDSFDGDSFAVDKCRTHLSSGEDPACMAIGCRARAACPVGIPYSETQIRFHMKAFGEA